MIIVALVNFSFILLGYKTTLEQAALIYTWSL